MDKFLNYFDSRYRKNLVRGKASDCGPIITISRQTGSDGVAIAKKLAAKLNRKYGTKRWHCIDKKVLIATAEKLEKDPERVKNYFGSESSKLSEMIKSVSEPNISDVKDKMLYIDIINSICKDGYVVLVGRGGVSITHSVKKSLHIRLVAPFYWRVDNIMKKKNMDIEEAEEFVVDTDEKRYNAILNFLEKRPLNIDYLFDATLNRRSYSVEQIAQIITQLYEKRIEMVMNQPDGVANNLMDSFG